MHGELHKLEIEFSETTVATYMIKRRGPPSQTWRTFLWNHVQGCRGGAIARADSNSARRAEVPQADHANAGVAC